MSDSQTAINVLFALAGFLGAWVLNSLRDSIASLHKSDAELAVKVQSIEVLVAGTYVKRDELERIAQALFAKLDKIDAKLDTKVDK